MESSLGLRETKTQSPLFKVEKLVTRMWEHPLVDDRMRENRKRGKILLQKVIANSDLADSKYIGIPVGSAMWVVDQDSDHDFNLVTSEENRGKYDKLLFQYGHGSEDKKFPVDIFTARYDYDLVKTPSPALLFTPDEYIVGDLEFIHSLRLRIIDAIESSGEKAWSPDFLAQWWSMTKNWPQIHGKRKERFDFAVSNRSQQTNRPSKWEAAYRHRVFNFQLPSFEDYASAIKQTNGALRINPRFVTRGMSTKV